MKYKYSFSDFASNPLPYNFKSFEIGDFKVPFYVPAPIDNLSTYYKGGVVPCVFLNTVTDGIVHPSLGLLTYSYVLPRSQVGDNIPVCLYLTRKNDTLFAVNLWDISFSYSVNQGFSGNASYSDYSYGVAFYPYIGQFCVYSDISDNYVIYGSFGSLSDAMDFASDFYISSIDVIRVQICYVIGALEHPFLGNTNILAPAPYVYFFGGDLCPIVPLSCCKDLDYSPLIKLLGGQ